MELRCPDCLSPEVGPPADGAAGEMRCDNCGERFGRGEALVTVAEAESRIPAPPPERLFELDVGRARDELRDPDGAIRVLDPFSDADELDGTIGAARGEGIIRSRREWATISAYPKSIGERDPLLAVHPGDGPTLLGFAVELRRHDDEDPVAFTVRVLEDMVDEANGLAAGRAADSERLDRIAAYLNQPGHDGGDICEFVGAEIAASGRRLLDVDG